MAGTAAWGANAQKPCDGLDASLCMLPFPNDYYSMADPGMETGRRVDFPAAAFPKSSSGQSFEPAAWEGNDGFSPGSTILAHVPGLDLVASRAATISDMGASLAPTSPIILIDARTATRWPTWAELDVNDPNPATPAPHRPPGAQPDRGRPLHRRAAQPEDRRRVGSRAGTGVRRSARGDRAGCRWPRPCVHRPPALGRAGIAPRWRGSCRPLSGLGLHRGESPQPHAARARSCGTRRSRHSRRARGPSR